MTQKISLSGAFALLAAISLPLLPLAEAQKAGRTAEAVRVFDKLSEYYQIPAAERTLFRPMYTVALRDRSFANMLSLSVDGVNRPINLDPRGVVLNPPSAAELRNGARIIVATEGPANISLTLAPVIPLSSAIASADVIGAIDQANKAIERFAGLASMFAPRIKGVAFASPSATRSVLVFQDGRRVALKQSGGEFLVPLDAVRGSIRIEFQSAPSSIRFIQ